MPFSVTARSAAIAFGLILSLPSALAQEQIEPALENQPSPNPQQQEASQVGQQDASPEQESAPNLLPGIQGIEAAIRDLVSDEDDEARERQEDRENADLSAQQKMARWTALMGIAAFLGVFLTVVGLWLIYGTLKYTRAMADDTRRTVDAAVTTAEEAKKSTDAAAEMAKAAIDANPISRSTFVESQRARLIVKSINTIEPLIWKDLQASTTFSINIANVGATTAVAVFPHAEFIIEGSRRKLILTKMIQNNIQTHRSEFGWTIENGQIFPINIGLTLTREQVLDHSQRRSQGGRYDEYTAPIISPRVIGCVIYATIVDDKLYHAAFIADVFALREDGEPMVICPAAGNIPKDRLHVRLDPIGKLIAG